jgi:bacillopeptidase F
MHPDLHNRWRGGTNSWFDPIAGTQIPFESDFDDYHGTKTVGIIVGGSAGASAIGVAPDAHWIAARIFDDNGIAWEPDVHSAFEWILDPDGDPNTDDCPDITNIAWGFEKDPNRCIDVFQPDIDNLKQAGIAVICAAGNRGELIGPSSTSPANYSRSFSVGAVESYQPYNIALWSSRGPSCCQNEIFPNVVAPGLNIRTTDFLGYANVTGTSFAGSHVSGAMALLRNAFPNVDVIEIEWALQRTALDLDTPGPDNNYGHGFIDILKAYELISVDLNTDQSIDFHDFGILAEHWGEQNCGQPDWCGRADVNRNSEVTGADLALMSCYWLKR